jgi:drug/metabolite transporter (DMT)-like permease
MAETLPFQTAELARASSSTRKHSLQSHHRLCTRLQVWGSTYLALAVTSAEGIPPFVIRPTRFLIAGPVMLAGCGLFGRRVCISRRSLDLATTGMLLLVFGNGGLTWAEQYVPTGFAPPIVAVTPIWFLVLATFVFRCERTLYRGMIGLAILVWP